MTSGSDPFIGMTLGSYEILEAVGQGGMARIYKGFHSELNRYAAVKVVHWGLQEDPEFTERFRREAQAIASLRHPNIVQIFDFGQHESGYYMVMEFIDGGDLAVLLHRYKTNQDYLPHENVVRIVKEIGAALDYAHAHSVIHRDIKPSNVMLNHEGQSILTDFGLVMLPAQSSQATLGSTFGTPHYVAPEQAISSAAAVPASDIYSLGVVIYEMVTGEVPFDDESPLSVALKHVSDVPPPPTSINPDIPREVEEVILRALAKDPADRFANGKELALALEAAYTGEAAGSGSGAVVPPVIPAGVPPAADVSGMTLPNAGAVSPVTPATKPQIPEEYTGQPPAKEKERMPIWALIAIIAVAGILVGAIGLYLFNNFGTGLQPTATPIIAVIAETPTETPTSTATNTATPENRYRWREPLPQMR